MENENGGNIDSVVTPTTPAPEQPDAEQPRTFTQEELNTIIGERLDRVLKKYDVESFEELDAKLKSLNDDKEGLLSERDVLSKERDELRNQHNELNELHNTLSEQYKSLLKDFAYLKNNIKEDKFADIEAIFKGKELEINDENLKAELQSHPEWVKPTQTIKELSFVDNKHDDSLDEKEKLKKYFGVDF